MSLYCELDPHLLGSANGRCLALVCVVVPVPMFILLARVARTVDWFQRLEINMLYCHMHYYVA
jgi:hypothetical protein